MQSFDAVQREELRVLSWYSFCGEFVLLTVKT
jgi:hypothetical protein